MSNMVSAIYKCDQIAPKGFDDAVINRNMILLMEM